MSKLVLTDIANLQNEQSVVATIVANNRLIEAAIETLLSRDGTSPNQMTAEMDMNSKKIINLGAPTLNQDAVRLIDLDVVSGNPTNLVTLTDGATVNLDASAGYVFDLVAAGDRTIAVPTGAPATGTTKKIIIRHTASGGARTLTLTTGSPGSFKFGLDITGLSATGSGQTDLIGCIWSEALNRWLVVAYAKGFI